MQYIQSPNFWEGRAGQQIKGIVIHVSGGKYDNNLKWYKNPASSVSAHLLISKNGDVTKMVDYKDSAWHAAPESFPTWSGMVPGINPNRITCGIECEGSLGELWTEPQMSALCVCVKEILASAGLEVNRNTVISHNEIASDREDTRLWADEVVKRLNVSKNLTSNLGFKEKLEKAIELLNEVIKES